MKKHRKMSALQRKYFGKGHARVASASKKSKKRRSVSVGKKKKSSSKGGFGGVKTMISPIIAGVADSYLDPMLPIDGIGATAVGMFMHNETMKNLGLYKVGYSIGNIIPLPGRTGNAQGALL